MGINGRDFWRYFRTFGYTCAFSLIFSSAFAIGDGFDCSVASASISATAASMDVSYAPATHKASCSFPSDIGLPFDSGKTYHRYYWSEPDLRFKEETVYGYPLNQYVTDYKVCMLVRTYSNGFKNVIAGIGCYPGLPEEPCDHPCCPCFDDPDRECVANEDPTISYADGGVNLVCDVKCPSTPQMSGRTSQDFFRWSYDKPNTTGSNKSTVCLLDCAEGSYTSNLGGEYTCQQCGGLPNCDPASVEYQPQCCTNVEPNCALNMQNLSCKSCDDEPFQSHCTAACDSFRSAGVADRVSYCALNEPADCALPEFSSRPECNTPPDVSCGDPANAYTKACEDYCWLHPSSEACKPVLNCSRHLDDPMCSDWCALPENAGSSFCAPDCSVGGNVSGCHDEMWKLDCSKMPEHSYCQNNPSLNCQLTPNDPSCRALESLPVIPGVDCRKNPSDSRCLSPSIPGGGSGSSGGTAPSQPDLGPNEITPAVTNPCTDPDGDGVYTCTTSGGSSYTAPTGSVRCEGSGTVMGTVECYDEVGGPSVAPINPDGDFQYPSLPVNPLDNLGKTGVLPSLSGASCPVFEINLSKVNLGGLQPFSNYRISIHCDFIKGRTLDLLRLFFMISYILVAFRIVLEA